MRYEAIFHNPTSTFAVIDTFAPLGREIVMSFWKTRGQAQRAANRLNTERKGN